jgi:hypothetical protein
MPGMPAETTRRRHHTSSHSIIMFCIPERCARAEHVAQCTAWKAPGFVLRQLTSLRMFKAISYSSYCLLSNAQHTCGGMGTGPLRWVDTVIQDTGDRTVLVHAVHVLHLPPPSPLPRRAVCGADGGCPGGSRTTPNACPAHYRMRRGHRDAAQ